MANDYLALQDRVADEVISSSTAAASGIESQIQREILSAIKHYERQRFWFNEDTDTSLSTAAGTAFVANEADTLQIFSVQVTLNGQIQPPLVRRGWDWYVDNTGNDTRIQGIPAYYAEYQDRIWFCSVPDAVYPLTIARLKQLTALSAPTDFNAWTADGEELIRARAAAAVLIRVRQDADARQEYMALSMRGEPYLSGFEKIAHQSLLTTSKLRRAAGDLATDLPVQHGRFNINRGW
jgi:hypothetical protein